MYEGIWHFLALSLSNNEVLVA